jgi:hypothetical protein
VCGVTWVWVRGKKTHTWVRLDGSGGMGLFAIADGIRLTAPQCTHRRGKFKKYDGPRSNTKSSMRVDRIEASRWELSFGGFLRFSAIGCAEVFFFFDLFGRVKNMGLYTALYPCRQISALVCGGYNNHARFRLDMARSFCGQ